MNMTWRPAWPHSVAGVAEPKTLPRKTVRSSRLPAMPTGHAQTRRRMPPTALARPKMLPSTSRRIRTDPPTGICASKSHRKRSMCVSFLPSRTAMAPGVYDSAIMRRRSGRRSNSCTCFSHPDFNCRYRNFTDSTVCRHPSRRKALARGSRTVTAGSDLHRPRSTYVCCYSDTTAGLPGLFPGLPTLRPASSSRAVPCRDRGVSGGPGRPEPFDRPSAGSAAP